MTLCGMVLTSCEREEEDGLSKVTYTATSEAGSSKTWLNSSDELKWEKNESIMVSDGSRHTVYSTNGDVANDYSMATFYCAVGQDVAGDVQVYYPSANYVSDGVMSLPAEQRYSGTKGVVGFPMYTESSDHELHFTNLCGLFSITLQKAGKRVSSITIVADKAVSGNFPVAASGSVWQLEAGEAVSNASNTVVLDCNNPDNDSPSTFMGSTEPMQEEEPGVDITNATVFNIYLPVGTYSIFDIVITATDGTSCVKGLNGSGSLVIKRNERVTLTPATLDFVEPIRYTTTDGSNLSDAFSSVAGDGTPKCVITRDGSQWVANYASPVTNVDGYKFYSNQKLNSVVLPSTVISLGPAAFANCGKLVDVTCYSQTVPTLGASVFSNIGIIWPATTTSAVLHVPSSMVSAYSGSSWYGYFASIESL